MGSTDTVKSIDPPTCTDQLLWNTWLSSLHLPCLTVGDELGSVYVVRKGTAVPCEADS